MSKFIRLYTLNKGISHLYPFTDTVFFFNKLRVGGNPASSKSIYAILNIYYYLKKKIYLAAPGLSYGT